MDAKLYRRSLTGSRADIEFAEPEFVAGEMRILLETFVV
jgi:hypothetical protein